VTSGRILVVDDEPGMLRAVERVLAADHAVLALPTPEQALDAGLAFEPDIALLDVRLPGMTGLDLMDRLRVSRPDLDVILMTGSQSETDATHVDAILRKAFYFIQKPFDRRVLLTLVERCLELRRLESDNRRHVTRLESELREARAFQESLLPPASARIGSVALAARSIPSAELGGDFVAYADTGAGGLRSSSPMSPDTAYRPRCSPGWSSTRSTPPAPTAALRSRRSGASSTDSTASRRAAS